MCGLVEANLDLCRVPEAETEVLCSEADDFLRQTEARGRPPWDIIFFDPPYATNYLHTLALIDDHAANLVSPGGLLIVEHHHKNALKDSLGELQRIRILKQGDSSLSFFEHSNR